MNPSHPKLNSSLDNKYSFNNLSDHPEKSSMKYSPKYVVAAEHDSASLLLKVVNILRRKLM